MGDSFSRPGQDSEEAPKLRMAPPETPEELARRFEREQRAIGLKREEALSESLAPYRVGSVPYLNSVPLVRGLEDQVVYQWPSELASMLRRDELDAALVSLVEVLYADRYDILDGIAVASLGEVLSVVLAHRRPVEAVDVVYCDPASLTSVSLLRVLLAERGFHPEFRTLAGYDWERLPDYALLIGNPALEFRFRQRDHELWDLGGAWYEMTHLPFVYAVWALRREIDHGPLRRRLKEARDFGLDTLDVIIGERNEFDLDFRKDYLGWHIHYHLGTDEKRGIAKFIELLRRHEGVPIYEPRFVA